MSREREESLAFLQQVLVGAGRVGEGWLGLAVVPDGREAVIMFRWQDDPTVYGIRVDLDREHAWWRYEPVGTLWEDLETGLIQRATRRLTTACVELDRSLADRERYESLHPSHRA